MHTRDHFLVLPSAQTPDAHTHTHAHTHTQAHTLTHPSVLMQRVSGPDRKQRELVRETEQGLRTGLFGKRKGGGGGGRGRAGGPSPLFNGRVNKSLVKLSGPQPRVFTALVSITNKSRIPLTASTITTAQLPLLPLFPLSCLALLGTAN